MGYRTNFSHAPDGTKVDFNGMDEEQRKKVLEAMKKGNFGL
jgi:hypothetical protein